MRIKLDHTVVASTDSESAAHRFAEIMDLVAVNGKASTASSSRFV